MNTGLILHTVLGLLLLLIPAGALYLLERKALKSFGIAIVRMVLQLLVLCLMVRILIRVDNLWLSILWLLLMAFYAAWIVISRCRNQGDKSSDSILPHGAVPMIPVGMGLFVGVMVVGLWLLGLVFPVRISSACWFVPVTALLRDTQRQ